MTAQPEPRPLAALRAGGKRAMALALARVEAAPCEQLTLALLDAAYAAPGGHVIGVTGPPGVGKSTLVSRLLRAYREEGRTVGVIAVDPSSRRSGGALLGDRMRIEVDPDDQGIFVRSMAARERLGGLAPLTHSAVVLMRAVYDRVIVETVGVGQSEVDVASVCDTLVLCIQPASGDSLQYMKSGIAEIPDLAVVSKADLGHAARKAGADLEAVLAISGERDGWRVPVLLASGTTGDGVDALRARMAEHASHLAAEGRLSLRRQTQIEAWLRGAVREEFGRFGLERAARLPGGLELEAGCSPFRRLRDIDRTLRERRLVPLP